MNENTNRIVYTHTPRNPRLAAYSQQLRKDMPDAERRLWHYIRREQLGVKFRRQYMVGPYIADFACLERKVIIELDGGQHATRYGYDRIRDEYLLEQGFRILRFWNHEMFENLEGVITIIQQSLITDVK